MRRPSATAIETLKNGIPRFAFSDPSIGSTTTTVESPSTKPTSSETIETPSGRNRSRTTRSASASTAVVSSPPSPRRSTGSRSSRVGISASTPRTSATAARQSSSQSVKRVEEQAGGELRIEERALLRHDVATAGDLPHVLDARRAEQERGLRLAAVDGRDRVVSLRRVRHALRLQRVDDLGIEPVALDELIPAVAVEHDAGKLVPGRIDRRAGDTVHRPRKTVRREDGQALLVGRHDHRQKPRGLAERERSLVPVVAVGDEELRVGELLRERVAELGVEAPQLVAADLQIGLAQPVDLDRPVPEEEQRLELRARRAQEAQPALLRPGMRALVRQDHAALVRLRMQRGDEPLAAARDAVGAYVVLREPPVRRLRVADEHTLLLPGGKIAGRLLLRVGERQVDDVVRAAGEIARALLLGDDVVRRRDDGLEIGHVVAESPKGANARHRGPSLVSPRRALPSFWRAKSAL